MSKVTRLLEGAQAGDRRAAADLLPIVYEELRKLAAARMAAEASGHTLTPTALVHEAYMRLVGPKGDVRWDGRGHFFAAAAEAMRRILVEAARRKQAEKHGGGRERVALDGLADLAQPHARLVELDAALERLATEEPEVAALVNLRYFAGLTIEQAAAALGVSVRTANRHWAYAKAWLYQELEGADNQETERNL
jgi:RNA polymerase sigma factor (TIGR02999 family)